MIAGAIYATFPFFLLLYCFSSVATNDLLHLPPPFRDELAALSLRRAYLYRLCHAETR